MKTPRVLAIHDMCAFGRCSLTAVLPVLSTMGIQVCPFPTAIYSNNLTYDNIDFYDFSPHMRHFMDIWQKNSYEYDAIYSGFLANAEQISIVEDAISRFAKKDTIVIVDPAMPLRPSDTTIHTLFLFQSGERGNLTGILDTLCFILIFRHKSCFPLQYPFVVRNAI